MALISLRSVAPARDTCSLAGSWIQPPQPIAAPRPVYPGQAFDPLYDLIQTYRTSVPEVRLQLGLIEDATFIVKPGLDGLILNNDGVAIKETSYYTEIYSKGIECKELEFDEPILDIGGSGDVFVAFDGAWVIYYHWLFFCLGSAGIAQKVLPDTTLIATPNWEACARTRHSGISNEVFDQVKRVVDSTRLLSLSDGAYRTRRAYFLYVDGGQPSDAVLHSMYRDVFRGLRSQTTQLRQSRIFVSRGGRGGAARVTELDEKIFDDVLIDYDIKKVYLENLNFQSQIDHFSNASLIISPHGSSLANLVFAPQTARVLELQTEMDWPGSLRPWFYLLAGVSNLSYAFLNREAGDFQAQRLREALKILDVSRPTFNLGSKAWRIARQRLDAALIRFRKSALARIRALWSRVFKAG
jgi:hypothetical protein